MVFKFKGYDGYSVDPQTVGNVCLSLEQTVGLTAQALVDASRGEEAPLHSMFEWNNEVAAEKYRNKQAASIIRCLVIEDETQHNEPVKAFFSVVENEREYKSIHTILRSPTLSDQLLADAYKDMQIFVRRYSSIKELVGVCVEMDAAIEKKRKEEEHGYI